MNDYIIVTDSTADLSADLVKELSIEIVHFKYDISGKTYQNYPDGHELGFKKFYTLLRDGELSTTTQNNPQFYEEYFSKFLSAGKDVFYISFSAALSGSYNSAYIAAQKLRDLYPERKLVVVDSKAASGGQGMLVYLAVKKKNEGMSIDELEKWVTENTDHICHWFTVDDLFFLKRGGRVSSVSAVLGSALGIKPVLHVDNEGRLIPMRKVRGRKKALEALVEEMEKTCVMPQEQTIFISHGDCEEDARYLAALIKEKFAVKDIIINYIGPVIGAHSGPGTVALFFVGSVK